jgi:hypothetical protein
MNRRDAALHLARRYPGGIEALAPRMGKKPDTLRKELTGVEGYKWGVDEEELMISLCQAAGVADSIAPITAAAVNAGALVIPLPRELSAQGGSFQCLADAAREFGEFVASVAEAEADGCVTANELRRVERELGELVAKGQGCVARLKAVHEAGKPAHLKAVGGA